VGASVHFRRTLSGTAAGSGTLDFSHTALLQPIVILDSNGTQILGSAMSDSGFQYAVAQPTAAAVPEPGTMALLGNRLDGPRRRRHRPKRES